MIRKTCFASLVILLVVGLLTAATIDPKKESLLYKTSQVTEPATIIKPDTPLDINVVYDRPNRDNPQDVAYGEDLEVGYTWYDYQHNGSVGKMVVVDGEGGIHFAWMSGFDPQQGERHVLYNYVNPQGDLTFPAEERTIADNGNRSGYCAIDYVPADNRAAVFYHVTGHVPNDPAFLGTAMSTDFLPGIGAFTAGYPNPIPETQLAWPKGAVDMQNVAHVLSTENSPEEQLWQRVAYWRGTSNQDFQEWTWNEDGVARIVDVAGVISAVPAASPQSNKVVLAWHHNLVGQELQQPNGDWDQARGGWQRMNDIRYLVSEDGENWDWEDGVESITDIIRPIPELADVNMEEAYGDTFRPYCDVDIAFDPWEDGDDLYAVFAASGFQEEPVADDDPEPVDIVYATMGHLWFWNSVEDTLTMIYDGWYNQYMNNANAPEGRSFRCGVWRLNADRGSIAFDPDNPGTIYVVWNHFAKIYDIAEDEDGNEYIDFYENASDTSAQGYINADVMVSVSTDYGITWRDPVNITDTHWEGDVAPEPGECLSENWVSAAEVANGNLHVFYVRDLDAGGIPQEEGVTTNNPVVYHKVALEDIPLNDPVELPREGFQFHNYPDFSPRVADITRSVAVPITDQEVEISATAEPTGGRELSHVYLQYVLNPEADGELNPDNIVEVEMAAEGEGYVGSIPGQGNGTVVWYRVKATDNEDGETIKPDDEWGAYVARDNGVLNIHDIQYRPRDWWGDYSSYKDLEVTVTGYVTTPAEFNDLYGAFAIQEASQHFSGIFVKPETPDIEVPQYAIGTHLEITGIVRERDELNPEVWRYMTYIEITGAEAVTETGNQPMEFDPIEATVLDMSSMDQLAEHLEGCLVQLNNAEIGPVDDVNEPFRDVYRTLIEWDEDNISNRAWLSAYGLTNDDKDAIDWDNLRQGSTFSYLAGVFVENETYAIAPRWEDDFGESAVREDENLLPTQVSLDPAYPNPFNAMTRVGFNLNKAANVKLGVYDLAGRLVATIAEGHMQAGQFETMYNAGDLTTGVYILKLEAGNVTDVQKLILIK